jgi:hypothetical protein
VQKVHTRKSLRFRLVGDASGSLISIRVGLDEPMEHGRSGNSSTSAGHLLFALPTARLVSTICIHFVIITSEESPESVFVVKIITKCIRFVINLVDERYSPFNFRAKRQLINDKTV